jgi:hypothetical protein
MMLALLLLPRVAAHTAHASGKATTSHTTKLKAATTTCTGRKQSRAQSQSLVKRTIFQPPPPITPNWKPPPPPVW